MPLHSKKPAKAEQADPLFGHEDGGDSECKKCGLDIAAQVAAKAQCSVKESA